MSQCLKPTTNHNGSPPAEAFAALVMRLNAVTALSEVIELSVHGAMDLLQGDAASLWLTDGDSRQLSCRYQTDDPVRLRCSGTAILPLKVGCVVLGVIHVHFRARDPHPAPEAIAYGEAIACQCALAVERATLYEQERAARSEAEARAEHFQTLISIISDGVTVVDGRGEVILRNQRSAEITGVTGPDPVSGEEYPCPSVLGPDGEPVAADQTPVGRVLRGDTVRDEEIIIRRHDGSERSVIWSGGAVRDASGAVALAIISFRDVTGERQLEMAKDQVMQVLAHELRNPLAAASGLIQLVAERYRTADPGWVEEHLRLAGLELARLDGLTNDILAGYQVSQGRLLLTLQPLDLADVVQKAAAQYGWGAPTHRFIVEFPAEPPIRLNGDARLLTQVVGNLLSNAFKYTPPEGTVRLCRTLEPGAVVLRVEDSGVGIPQDQLEGVFRGFYRATNLQGRPGGLGLGLYVSRHIARSHGGDLWAESRPGGGTAMCLRLPLDGPGPGLAT